PYGLPIDERASLPDANMSPVLDIGGGLFKGQILDPPKDVEITDGCSRVTFVRETIHSNFLRGLEGNGVRNQPLCLLKALCHLLFAPDKEQVDRVTCCPGLGMGYFRIYRKIIGIRVKTDNGHECGE